MALLFSLHLTPHPHLWGKPCVHAVKARGAVGIYDNKDGELYVPDFGAVREALPHYLRKAFDRAADCRADQSTAYGRTFWFPQHCEITESGDFKPSAPYLHLRTSRGAPLRTLYAIPYRFEPKVPALESTHAAV